MQNEEFWKKERKLGAHKKIRPGDKISPSRKGTTKRGGKRPGSGRKATTKKVVVKAVAEAVEKKPVKPRRTVTVSEKLKRQLLAAERKSVRNGFKPMAEALVEIAKSPDKRTAMPAMKLFYDVTTVKETETDITVHEAKAPVISLPPMEADPALKMVEAGTEEKSA